MSLSTESIPAIEVFLGERALIAWDTSDLQEQLSFSISSASWSVEDSTILSLANSGDSIGNIYQVAVDTLAKGVSHVILNLTTSDFRQNPTILIKKINVIDPEAKGI